MIPRILSIHIYPIKSLGGISLKKGELSDIGIRYDRKWMLVDEKGVFLSQRNHPKMALFDLSIKDENLLVQYEEKHISIPLAEKPHNEKMRVSVWEDEMTAVKMGQEYDHFFSDILGFKVYLVQKLASEKRPVKNHKEVSINFSDACQLLVIGKASLMELNSKLEKPVKMNRFRPNIVYDGDTAHEDDQWKKIEINGNILSYVKPCARCRIIMTDQETAQLDKAPFKALSRYRMINKKVFFGSYFSIIENINSEIKVGDTLNIIPVK